MSERTIGLLSEASSLFSFRHAVRERNPKSEKILRDSFIRTAGKTLRREMFRRKHGFAPQNVTIAPTDWCNLSCIDCYANANENPPDELETSVIDNAIEEASDKWGMLFFTITGGESLSQAMDIAKKYPSIPIQLYTNGTLIDHGIAKEMAQMGNIFPLVSIEGLEEETDRIRGKGVYKKVMDAMDILTDEGVIWGISFTLTRNNADVYDNHEFIDTFINKGAMLGRFLTYMPSGRNASFDKVPTLEQRGKQGNALRELEREKVKFYSVDYLNNPGAFGGCAAAGARYLYINQLGDVFPCVFTPIPAIFNLKDAYNGVYAKEGLPIKSIEDILIHDPVLRLARQISFRRPTEQSCLLIDRPEEFRNALNDLIANYPSASFGNFFNTANGQDLLGRYLQRASAILSV
jgi:MoaA/NifB/PqqE/SkfB family radical SAM enzyme